MINVCPLIGSLVRRQRLSEPPWLSASSPPSTEELRTASSRPSWRPDSPCTHTHTELPWWPQTETHTCGDGYHGDRLTCTRHCETDPGCPPRSAGRPTHTHTQRSVAVVRSGAVCIFECIKVSHHLPSCGSHVVSLCQPLLILRICCVLTHTHRMSLSGSV